MSLQNIEEVLDHANNIPREISRNIKMIRVLDEDFSKKFTNALQLKKKYIANYQSKTKSTDNSQEVLKQLEKEFEECSNLCDQKVEISNDCYFMIDNNLKKINELIASFEKDLKNTQSDKIRKNSLLDEDNVSIKKKKSKIKLKKDNFIGIKKLRKIDKSEESIPTSNLNNFEDITYAEIDGKLDPSEPLFCFCNYISYGNMVRCDNNVCTRQWFHFSCVGLTSFPKGKWYCSPECARHKKPKNK